MKRMIITMMLGLTMLAACGCESQPGDEVVKAPVREVLPPRATTPAFKGLEIYSWQDTDTGVWYMAQLPGTNRNKFAGEVLERSTKTELRSLQQVKDMLHGFAPGETVSWNTWTEGELPENIQWGVPEWMATEDAQGELIDYATSLEINLYIATNP